MPQQHYSRCDLELLTIEKLTDGSTAIVDNRSKSVHSLNATATAVWEACAQGATAAEIEASLATRFGTSLEPELVRHALAQLQKANLIEASSPIAIEAIDLGRRSMLQRAGAAGAIAIPVVLTLAASEQRAYAFQSLSTTTTTLGPPG